MTLGSLSSNIFLKSSGTPMNQHIKSMLVVGFSTILVTTSFAQAQKTSTSTSTTSAYKVKTKTSTQMAPKKLSELNKVYGVVVRDGVKAGIVTIGMPRQGRVEVDTNTARIVTKDGKMFNVKNLTPGSNITAVGKMGAKTFKATEVKVNYVRVPGAIKKKLQPTTAGVSPTDIKPKTKTIRKSG